MFIAEAPGRNGAERTGIPIYGDPTGDNFEALLKSADIKREDIFVTNCVLCNPQDTSGNNRPPDTEEIVNCSLHLESTIRLVDPRVVVTLGNKALQALDLIEPHKLVLNTGAATITYWLGRLLFPLYHPSPRALIYRNTEKQRADYRKLANLIKTLAGD